MPVSSGVWCDEFRWHPRPPGKTSPPTLSNRQVSRLTTGNPALMQFSELPRRAPALQPDILLWRHFFNVLVFRHVENVPPQLPPTSTPPGPDSPLPSFGHTFLG